MNKKIDELLKKGEEMAKKHEDLLNEILNNPQVPQELKNGIIKSKENFEKDKEMYEKYLEENKHRKILGYNPDNFEPIYENE